MMNKLKLKPGTVRKRMADLWRRHDESLKQVVKDEDEIKARCPHDWSYEADASGNNDSGYWCNICGKRRYKVHGKYED